MATEEQKAAFDDFVYKVSHDLAAPLRHTREFSNLLLEQLDSKLDEDEEYLASVVKKSVVLAESRLEALTRLYRISSGTLESVEVDMQVVCDEVLAEFQPVLFRRDISITISSLPKVRGDRTQLTELIYQLIDNSIRYKKDENDSFIQISSKTGDNYCELNITDNGIGIDPGNSERVFSLFCTDASRGAVCGLGLGLTLCRTIVERHGGGICFDSDADSVTIMIVSLPV